MTVTEYPKFLGAAEANQLDQAFNRIAQALVEGRAQFLFGAGMSRGSGLPLGSDLAMTLLREFFPAAVADKSLSDERLKELVAEFPFEAIVHAVEQQPGCKRDDLTKILKKILIDPHPTTSNAHEAFLSVIGADPRIKEIFTTNYDTLLEDALGPDFSAAITERNATDIEKERDGGKIPVIYLRGKLDGDYQITEPEIVSDKYRLLMEGFKAALHTAEAFIFVGCSLNDIDFRRFYISFLDQLNTRKISGKTTYFVSPARDSFSYTLGTAIWALRKAVWIPMGAEGFFTKLKGVVENRNLGGIREQVRRSYGVNDAELESLIERTAKLWRIDLQAALLFLYEARTRIGGGK